MSNNNQSAENVIPEEDRKKIQNLIVFDATIQEMSVLPKVERALGFIYDKATYTDEGWEGIYVRERHLFDKAYDLYLVNHEYLDNLTKE